VDGSNDTTRVGVKETVCWTGSSLGGGEGRENRLNYKTKSPTQSKYPGSRLTTAQTEVEKILASLA